MIKNLKKTDTYILIFFVFTFISSNFFEKNIFGINIDLFAITFFTTYFILFIKWNRDFIKKYLYLLLTLIFFQIFVCKLNNFSFFGLTKQFLPILIIYTSTYFIILNYGFRRIFKIYEIIIIMMCLFGIFQIFLNSFDISIYQKEMWRMNSFMKEPSHFGMLILPIVLKAIFEFKKPYIKLGILIVSLFWTLSVSVIFVLVISIVLFYLWKLFNSNQKIITKSGSSLFALIVSLIFILTTFYYMNFFDHLYTAGTLNSIIESNTQFLINEDIANVNYSYKEYFYNIVFNDEFFNAVELSIFSLTSIVKVAINILYQNPFGAGLGSNQEAFYLFKEIYINNNFLIFNNTEYLITKRYNFASNTSQSLFLRMIIEFGLIFLIFVIALLQKIAKNIFRFNKEKIIIFISLFSVILFKTLKLSSYIDYGTGFFLLSIIIMLYKDNEFNKNFN
tara:strand:- start:2504 stop:3847 length:1344 start_codon:yes stop_codon:yes gene_type:complete